MVEEQTTNLTSHTFAMTRRHHMCSRPRAYQQGTSGRNRYILGIGVGEIPMETFPGKSRSLEYIREGVISCGAGHFITGQLMTKVNTQVWSPPSILHISRIPLSVIRFVLIWSFLLSWFSYFCSNFNKMANFLRKVTHFFNLAPSNTVKSAKSNFLEKGPSTATDRPAWHVGLGFGIVRWLVADLGVIVSTVPAGDWRDGELFDTNHPKMTEDSDLTE